MANDLVELRGMCQRETIDIIDAVSLARGKSRIDQVNEILAEWCVKKVHESTLVYRAARGNPALVDADGKRAA